MFAVFESYMREHATLSDAEMKLIRDRTTVRAVRKKEKLLQEGEVCHYKMFVAKGLLRMYSMRENGSEHILSFAPESRWITEAESYDKLTPSRYYIDAIEDSEILQWTKHDFDALLSQIPNLRLFAERLIFNNLTLSRQRIVSAISSTAEEKYDEFINQYPDVFGRVPLHMVASYLGVTRKTLSRIRYAQLKG